MESSTKAKPMGETAKCSFLCGTKLSLIQGKLPPQKKGKLMNNDDIANFGSNGPCTDLELLIQYLRITMHFKVVFKVLTIVRALLCSTVRSTSMYWKIDDVPRSFEIRFFKCERFYVPWDIDFA